VETKIPGIDRASFAYGMLYIFQSAAMYATLVQSNTYQK
jgi:hypothetical protein